MTQQWSPASARASRLPTHSEPASLVDVLERVLDKGIVVAGDIRVDLLDIELLTIRLRLLIASVDRAKEMGIDWWEHDPTLSSGARDLAAENRLLRERIGALEADRPAGPDARNGHARAGAGSGPRRKKASP
jgi:hypothetical protein